MHHECPATCTVFYPVDPSIRIAMVLADPEAPHNHPLTTLNKATDSVKATYRDLVAAAGPVAGATVAKVDNGEWLSRL